MILFPSAKYPEVDLLNHVVVFSFLFLGKVSILIFIGMELIYISTKSVQGSHFFPHHCVHLFFSCLLIIDGLEYVLNLFHIQIDIT